jgi:hypothetical protein
MTNRPKATGTATETATVRYLIANGFPLAERRSMKGLLDQGDITGTPGICWEVKGGAAAKGASDGQVQLWLHETETERENARADIGVLVMSRAGIAARSAGRWWAVLLVGDVAHLAHGFAPERVPPKYFAPVRLHLSDAVWLLRLGGYGTALDVVPEAAYGDPSTEVCNDHRVRAATNE